MTNFEKVKEFHEVYRQPAADEPTLAYHKQEAEDEVLINMRLDLIDEEVAELHDAMAERNLQEVADALTDILYVVYGAGVAFGIDLDATFAEVHRSNLSKLDENGKPIYREDGKVLKGPNYSPPNLKPILGL